ncbi:MAG TPA: hypothetical protein PLQ17_05235 [Saprospiraceae bacterium]|nr:hypothetical protein [Saprospiraceae bacterium]
MKDKIRDFWYSFPVQLTILHFRNNLSLLLLWLLTIVFVTGYRGKLFGLQYLFTDPEYMGKVGPASFGFLGVAFGVFVMVWHMSSYLLSAFRFPFLASLARPFSKFIINNFTFPVIGFVAILSSIIYLQRFVEGKSWMEVAGYIIGWVSGVMIVIALLTLYLVATNKDYRTYTRHLKQHETEVFYTDPTELAYQKYASSERRVHTYLNESLQPRLVRNVAHYPYTVLQKVYKQNHKNAIILLIIGIVVLISLGLLSDNRYFRIPAGASILLLFSVLLSIVSAISFWFRNWRLQVFVVLILLANFITKNDRLLHFNQAYGIDYQKTPLPYDPDSCGVQYDDLKYANDKKSGFGVLEKWLDKQKSEKPYAVFLCASGGGQRAGVWAMEVLDSLNQMSTNELLDRTVMMSGASGGVLGMAFFRAIFENKRLLDPTYPYKSDFSKDMLNSLSFTLVSNDIFPNFSRFNYSGKTYFRDRAYAFEQQFNENTSGFLHRNLASFREAESQAQIPMLFITPTIINDGRRLIISPLDVSYMTQAPYHADSTRLPKDGIEFRDYFRSMQADSLSFLSALRMNCTYPFILPNVFLPTIPAMEVMDAGFNDNFGISVAYRYIWNYKEWLKENTAGIIIIQMAANDTRTEKNIQSNKGIIESLFSPLGFTRTIVKHQQYEQDNYIRSMMDYFGTANVHVLPFIYQPQQINERASMSFHLTQREKADLHRSLSTPENIASFRRYEQLFKDR